MTVALTYSRGTCQWTSDRNATTGLQKSMQRDRSPELAAVTGHAQSELSSDRKRLVLCIDDDIRGLSLRKALLEAQGYTVVTANSGRIGIRLAKDLPVDVVVVDYEMPEMDGAAVVVEVRKYRPAVPIIMLSGHQLSELPAFVLSRINKFIPKGLPPAEFLSMLEAVAVEGLGTQ